jgi:hypothetical protein
MKTILNWFFAILFILVVRPTLAGPDLQSFVSKYRGAKTEKQKRDLCIKLIDSDILYSGSDVGDLRTVFQKDFREMGMDASSNLLALVQFVPPIAPSIPGYPAVSTGWYLSITYRTNGSVIHYCLSNESKVRSAKLLYEKQLKSGEKIDVDLPVVEPPQHGSEK